MPPRRALIRLTTNLAQVRSGASLIGALSNDSDRRAAFIESQVKSKFEKMLHPPLTYLGDAFQYRTADGKFNSATNPHLGQAGAPYAKTVRIPFLLPPTFNVFGNHSPKTLRDQPLPNFPTPSSERIVGADSYSQVPSITHPLGALPDAGDLFDRLMAREEGGRPSQSGLSSMLIYHATIIIHDIFRTNDYDKNISDSSSYLDLSPLYGYTMEMQRKVRDDKFKLGLLKPDTFAEDRLLRQPPGVCIMLVMYNRYHNYAATQLRRINENGRFSVPKKYGGLKLTEVARNFKIVDQKAEGFQKARDEYEQAWKKWMADSSKSKLEKARRALRRIVDTSIMDEAEQKDFENEFDSAPLDDPDLKVVAAATKFFVSTEYNEDNFKGLCAEYDAALRRCNTDGLRLEDNYEKAKQAFQTFIDKAGISSDVQKKFEDAYDAA